MKICAICIVWTLFLSLSVSAQEKPSGLLVGDLKNDLSVFRWLKGNGPSQLKTGKVYLIEFGSTWCVPCRQAIPHLAKLQEQQKDALTIISLFVMEAKKNENDSSYLKTVKYFLSKYNASINYLVGVDNPSSSLVKGWLQGLSGIPWAFLIDKTGHIAWIGSPNSRDLAGAIDMVQKPGYTLEHAIKRDKEAKAKESPLIDIYKPMFVNSNGGNNDQFLFRSILTEYRGERAPQLQFISSPYFAKVQIDLNHPAMVQQVGASIDKLYYMAYADTMGQMVFSRTVENDEYPDTIARPYARDRYGNFWYKALLQVSDTTPFQWDYGMITNRYNYSLAIANNGVSAGALQRALRRDLDTYFGYKVSVEERMMPYWKLVATPQAREKLKPKKGGGKYFGERLGDSLFQYHNAIMKDILLQYLIYPFSYSNMSYGSKPMEEGPFIDETGIEGPIDYDMSILENAAIRNHDFKAVIDFIHRLGLDLQKGERLTKVVVINDPVN